jgi:hypothetical protein
VLVESMRVFFSILAVALASSPAALAARTELRVALWAKGEGIGSPRIWTLRCDPAGGTLPKPLRACRGLDRLAAPFAPVPAGSACSDIYSGPQVGIVTGSFRGRRVRAVFNRSDSCQTDRWSRVSFLFPGVPPSRD